MSVPRERFGDGLTWDDWLDRLGTHRNTWQRRYDQAALGDLRADYEAVPTPRYVLCLFDPESAAGQEVVPVIAKACDQAGVSGGVALRLFPVAEHRGLADQYLAEGPRSFPACVVFDRDWIQVGLWRLPLDAQREADWTRPALRAFLDALYGQPNRPWRGHQKVSKHRWKQAEQAPGNP